MRCCLVSHEYPPDTASGGIGTQTWNKAHALHRLGHKVEVVSCSARPLDTPMVTGVESGITVHRLRAPGNFCANPVPVHEQAAYLVGFSWAVLEALHRLLGARSFDIVNFPEYGADGFAFQLNRDASRGVPVVVHLHAPLAMLAERMGWPDPASRLFRTGTFMEAESIRLADGWMASSANIADFAANCYGIPRDRIDVVHCGVDCELFKPAPRARGSRPTVLFVGNVAVSKGVVSVFDAVLALRNRYPDILMRIVGPDNELARRLRRRAAAANAARNFEFLPFQRERAGVAVLFQQADVFASPAPQENGVANVYVEAMASGCPVIACNTGGAPEAVTHSVTGLLVAPGDGQAVRAAIERLLGDNRFRARLGQAGRERAQSYFAQSRYIERVLGAYERTIAHANASRAQGLQ